jgi:hypothetical protein
MALAAGVLATTPANAEWIETRTEHFVIAIDAEEAAARDYAVSLERFDAALRRLYNVPDEPEAASNPVRIVALSPRLFDSVCQCGSVAGYYRARAGGSTVFTIYNPKFDKKARAGWMTSQVVLLHEYGHHFMYAMAPIAYPLWFSEGFAEFNANVLFNDDQSITIGLPANYRANAIQGDYLNLTVQDFFTSVYGTPEIYGRGWLMTHYLMLAPARQGQLATYLRLLNTGKPSLDAAKEAFGDLGDLYKEMFAYRRGQLAAPVRVPPPDRPVEVTLTRLSPGAAEMMPLWARAMHGGPRARSDGFARDVERIAERYPDDARVAALRLEVTAQAGEASAAEAAADRALALDPQSIPAMLAKAAAIARRATEAKSADAETWRSVRTWLLKANHQDPNAALPLLRYYQSFLAAGEQPNAGAITALRRAAVLAPEDRTVRLLLARHWIEHDDPRAARALLQPIAYAPHRERGKNGAAEVIALIDADKLAEARTLMGVEVVKATKDE